MLPSIPVLRNFNARMRNSWYYIKELTDFTKIPLVHIKINFCLTSSKNLVTSYTLLSMTNHDDPAWLCFLTSSKVYFFVSASAILLPEVMKWLSLRACGISRPRLLGKASRAKRDHRITKLSKDKWNNGWKTVAPCLSFLAPSVTRVAICVSRVLLDGLGFLIGLCFTFSGLVLLYLVGFW